MAGETPSPANPSAIATHLQSQAKTLQLARDPYWLKLLHYTDGNNGIATSEITSPEFFLAQHGKTDPTAELVATIDALFQPVGNDPDQHAQCRFVARYRWLQKVLKWDGATPAIPLCRKFDEWQTHGHIDSISLVFATGYLSNPASLYGHMLLKFNSRDNVVVDELLAPSMSYGALVPDHENGLVYIYKGLLGGYDAGFSHDNFFRHSHSYAEVELRDLWEYELDLSKEEVDQIVTHSWELLRIKFPYYFFSKNCATQVAELLNLVIDAPLLPNTPWAIPATILDKLELAKHDGKVAIRDVRLIRSRQNRFYDKYSVLTTSERQAVKDAIESTETFRGPKYQALNNDERTLVLETLFDYYEFRAANEMARQKYADEKRKLLIERLKLPAKEISWPAPKLRPPDEGQPPLLTQLSGFSNNEHGEGLELRIRPAYYDLLAPNVGKLPNSGLSMFDLRLAYMEHKLRFRSFDLAHIDSLKTSQTQLPGDDNSAWKLKFGFEQQDLSCVQCTVFSLDGGWGKTAKPTDNATLFALLEGRAQTTTDESGNLALTPRLGVLANGAYWANQLSFGQRKYLNGSRTSEPIWRWEARIGDDRNWDWRLSYEHHVADEIKVSFSRYW